MLLLTNGHLVERLAMAESMLEATLQYQFGQHKALPTPSEWTSLVERFLPRQIATTPTPDTIKWYLNIHERYLLMETLTKEDASNSSMWVCWCCK
ncbi:hypothetical protein HanOQP8_Chr15g0560671 [Helianthus annuus]|nr:hypothetical protein HanHA89_Chr15g0601411 [Helianthus annuus]KAJ0651409.1 hypothetical protein HanOQP8_Chr15g0560671 [Helianthus annuus]